MFQFISIQIYELVYFGKYRRDLKSSIHCGRFQAIGPSVNDFLDAPRTGSVAGVIAVESSEAQASDN